MLVIEERQVWTMQTQVRPPRARSSGGRTLMLLGLVLALAAAAIVFYITSNVQGTQSQVVSVVVAQNTLSAGTILTLNNSTKPSVRIQDAFGIKRVDKQLAPADAYVFINQDKLNTDLNNKVVRQDFLASDVLRANDPRLADLGTTSGISLTNQNPPAQGVGQVLMTLTLDNGSFGVQPGDVVDVIATVAVVDATTGKSLGTYTQTTLPKVLIYAIDIPTKGKIVVVLSKQDAVYMADLEHVAISLTLVIRKPGDTSDPNTQSVNDGSILNHFKFGNPAQS
jgi:Flp pilus assembly protein CpaB